MHKKIYERKFKLSGEAVGLFNHQPKKSKDQFVFSF